MISMPVRWEYIQNIISDVFQPNTPKLNAWVVKKNGKILSPIFTNVKQCEQWKEDNTPNELVDFTRVNDESVRQRNKQS